MFSAKFTQYSLKVFCVISYIAVRKRLHTCSCVIYCVWQHGDYTWAAIINIVSKLHLPKCVFNWLISFLIGWSHTTESAGAESSPLSINLSIVQGSGIGPTFYIILESDLKPVSNVHIVFKYADYTNLLVQSSISSTSGCSSRHSFSYFELACV